MMNGRKPITTDDSYLLTEAIEAYLAAKKSKPSISSIRPRLAHVLDYLTQNDALATLCNEVNEEWIEDFREWNILIPVEEGNGSTDGLTRWDETHLRLPKRTNMIAGSMRRERFAKRATLEIDYEWFRFRESKNGFSTLTLWGRELPEAICAAGIQGYRLLDLVDFSSIPPHFFVRANPKVHSLKNVVRMRRMKDYGTLGKKVRSKGLLITMKDEWSRENWRYWTPEDGYSSTMKQP